MAALLTCDSFIAILNFALIRLSIIFRLPFSIKILLCKNQQLTTLCLVAIDNIDKNRYSLQSALGVKQVNNNKKAIPAVTNLAVFLCQYKI